MSAKTPARRAGDRWTTTRPRSCTAEYYGLARMEMEAAAGHMGYTTLDLDRERRRLKLRPAADPEEDTEAQAIVREAFDDARAGRNPSR